MYLREKDGVPVEVSSEEFHAWLKTDEHAIEQRVGDDTVEGLRISTVCLFVDHGAGYFFETMVFDHSDPAHPWSEIDGRRYRSRADAIDGHAEFIAKVKARQIVPRLVGAEEEGAG